MGQARLRGTPEQRCLQALERERLETQKRIEEKAKCDLERREQEQKRLAECKDDAERDEYFQRMSVKNRTSLRLTAAIAVAAAGLAMFHGTKRY